MGIINCLLVVKMFARSNFFIDTINTLTQIPSAATTRNVKQCVSFTPAVLTRPVDQYKYQAVYECVLASS